MMLSAMSQPASAEAGPAAPVAPAVDATPAIETVGLGKTYGGRVALHDLGLRVQQGEVFGFLGPNGAGKTTAIKILTGLVRPTTGSAQVLGRPAGDPEARRTLGYLPEEFRFPDWATGAELLDFHARLAGMPAAERSSAVAEVLDQVGLAGRGRDRIGGYSKGMTQRIGIAQALLGHPALILLDEPTSALDPVGRREIRDLIKQVRATGATVFLNSHLLSEVELVCDRVAIVDRGRIVRTGALGELVGPAARLRVHVEHLDARLLQALESYAAVLDVDGDTAVVAVEGAETAADIAAAVVSLGYRLHSLVPVQRSLEDVFVDLVHGETA